MKLLRLLLLVSLSFLRLTPVAAGPQVLSSSNPHPEKNALQEMYGGVVVNQTVTVAGQDFYQQFVAGWRDRALSDRYAISIHERPSARWGTRIWIEYAQRRIYQAQLPTGRAGIRALSEQAVEIAYQQVTDIDVERLLFRDADLGADEI